MSQLNPHPDPSVDGAAAPNTVTRDGQVGVRQPAEAVVGSAGGRRKRRRRGGGRGGERSMVPEAEFTSYYGRPIVKPAPWEIDIPAYLFAGGLAAGSSLVAAGADLTGRPVLRRVGRLTALGGLGVSMVALIHDLGKPSKFYNMLRTVKLTSPMSVGTWILSLYGPWAGVAAATEVVRMLPEPVRRRGPLPLAVPLDRPTGLLAALFAPPVAAYTAVLLSDTATPSWHEAFKELPFVFVGSGAAAAAGMGLVGAPVHETVPVRRLAAGAAAFELVMEGRMERSMGITAEPLHHGKAGRYMKAAKLLTAVGGAGALLGGRSRLLAAASGAALVAGSWCTRFGVFEAGQESAKDPKYTVVPQRERLRKEGPVRHRA